MSMIKKKYKVNFESFKELAVNQMELRFDAIEKEHVMRI